MNEGIDIGDTWGWGAHPRTKAFMDEIMEVCKKHNLAITPLQFGEISHHDGMEIVELEPDFEQYLRRRVAFSPVRLNIDAKEIK